MRPPHARRVDPDARLFHDPERPPESLASLMLGLAGIFAVILAVVLVWAAKGTP
jgi:hypothetical protein